MNTFENGNQDFSYGNPTVGLSHSLFRPGALQRCGQAFSPLTKGQTTPHPAFEAALHTQSISLHKHTWAHDKVLQALKPLLVATAEMVQGDVEKPTCSFNSRAH